MKTSEAILIEHAKKYFKDSPCDGEFILSKKDILPAMEEYADQFKTNRLFEFVYCGMTEESSYATISVHRTREGAEKAMEKHKAEEKIKYDKQMQRYIESWKKEGNDEETIKVFSESIGEFGRFQDWGINEIEVVD